MVKVNTEAKGLGMVFSKIYKAVVISWFFDNPNIKKTVREKWVYVNEKIDPKTVSRTSVFFFLEWCVEKGYLKFEGESGKGGEHRVYWSVITKPEFWTLVNKEVNDALAPYLKGQA